MAIRSNHYDTAFEAYLRTRRTPYVAVDESRRALVADASLKSMDFIVYAPGRWNLLVDVKGRQFPSATNGVRSGHRWENWATADDVECLLRWQEVFGEGFRAMLVFAYDLTDETDRADHRSVWEFRRKFYAFYGVWVDEYVALMTQRSPKWKTVTLRAADFRKLRQPFEAMLAEPVGSMTSPPIPAELSA